MEPLPIACTLSAEALAERKATTFEQLFVAVQELQPLKSGYRFGFEASDQILQRIVGMITMERKCCRFMNFELHVPAAEGPVWLSISGPEGTKQFLESMLNIKKL